MSNLDTEEKTSETAALSGDELKQLQGLVSQDLKALLKEDPETDEINYAQILQRLTSTSSMAEGVEAKLDNILENLDALLESLETTAEGESEVAEPAGNDTTASDKKSPS